MLKFMWRNRANDGRLLAGGGPLSAGRPGTAVCNSSPWRPAWRPANYSGTITTNTTWDSSDVRVIVGT